MGLVVLGQRWHKEKWQMNSRWRPHINNEETNRVVKKDHPDSNYKLAFDGFLSKVPIPPNQIYAINDAFPPEGATEEYESRLKQLDQVRLVKCTRLCQVHDEVILEGPTVSPNYISAGTATAPDADPYYPDQPLWANGQPMASPNHISTGAATGASTNSIEEIKWPHLSVL